MKVSRERYQPGSVRKVPRSQGFAWEFRFYLTAPDGKRKLKVQTFDSLMYPTEREVRKAVEGQLSALNSGTLGGRTNATLGTIIHRYMREDFLTLRHSTQTTNRASSTFTLGQSGKRCAWQMSPRWASSSGWTSWSLAPRRRRSSASIPEGQQILRHDCPISITGAAIWNGMPRTRAPIKDGSPVREYRQISVPLRASRPHCRRWRGRRWHASSLWDRRPGGDRHSR
jgi:hypothetical protein